MDGHHSDSESNSPTDNYTSYSRMNSEVVEKPSHFEQHSDCEDIFAILTSSGSESSPPSDQEVYVLDYGGLSPCSSSKTDGERIENINNVRYINHSVSRRPSIDNMFSSYPTESVNAAGDLEGLVDEGFDEELEYEFYDNEELKLPSNPDDVDINDTELQRILIDQTSTLPLSNALLDDIDFGVDVFDSEQGFQSLDCSLNKPSSPYHQHTPSPVSTSCDTTMQPSTTFNIDAGSYFPVTSSFIDFEPINTQLYTNSNIIASTPPGASWCNPTLGSVNIPRDVMDLNEASRMMTTELIPQTNSYLMTPMSPHTPMSDVHSPGPSTNRISRSLSPAPPSQAYNSPSTPPPSSGAYYIPSPAESSGSVYSNISFSNVATMDDQAVVEIPFHKFKKILDDTTVPESEKDRLKCIRRRGKNKMAAKNCRQKKMTIVCGLQQEIDQMRLAKARLASKTRSLEQEIAHFKHLCTHRYASR